MDKVLVIVNVPMLSKNFEVFVPTNKKVGVLKILLINGINQLLGCNLESPFNFCLKSKETGLNYDENKTVFENNINNSTEIILI